MGAGPMIKARANVVASAQLCMVGGNTVGIVARPAS